MRLHDTLTFGAFMANGLQHTIDTSSRLLEHWGCGHYELVHAMLQHAAYGHALLDAGFALIQESPGVAVYEVAEEFGAWYGAQVMQMAQCTEPDASACRAKLRALVTAFYNPMQSGDLSAVLAAVPLPNIDITI